MKKYLWFKKYITENWYLQREVSIIAETKSAWLLKDNFGSENWVMKDRNKLEEIENK